MVSLSKFLPAPCPYSHVGGWYVRDQELISRLWYNGVQALQFPQSALRTSSSITGITGLFFSTFFGGDDTTWASPTQQFSYYRNIQLFAGSGASTAAGPSTTTSSTGSKGGAGARMGGAGGWTAAAVLGSVGVLAVVGWGMI